MSPCGTAGTATAVLLWGRCLLGQQMAVGTLERHLCHDWKRNVDSQPLWLKLTLAVKGVSAQRCWDPVSRAWASSGSLDESRGCDQKGLGTFSPVSRLYLFPHTKCTASWQKPRSKSGVVAPHLCLRLLLSSYKTPPEFGTWLHTTSLPTVQMKPVPCIPVKASRHQQPSVPRWRGVGHGWCKSWTPNTPMAGEWI